MVRRWGFNLYFFVVSKIYWQEAKQILNVQDLNSELITKVQYIWLTFPIWKKNLRDLIAECFAWFIQIVDFYVLALLKVITCTYGSGGGGGWGYVMLSYGDWTLKLPVSNQPIPLISLGCFSTSNSVFKYAFLKPLIQSYCKWWKLSNLEGRERWKQGKNT